MIQELLPFIFGGVVGYNFPTEELRKDPFWSSLKMLMALMWIWAITRPIVIVLFMFGVR